MTTLAKIIVGSHAYGLATETSDVDYMEIFAVDAEQFLDPFYRVDDSTQSVSDTEDVTRHELGKYARLLHKGNPSALETLYLDDTFYVETSKVLKAFVLNRDSFVSKKALRAYLGFMKAQVKKSGANLDKKAFRHAVRLSQDGILLARQGFLRPTRDAWRREHMLSLENETPKFKDAYLTKLLNTLEDAYNKSTLPEEADKHVLREIVSDYRLDMLSWCV